ncbi:MAG: 4Fe-4S dicluster domain-containing protein [Candidatus Hodarchaeales archaeon]
MDQPSDAEQEAVLIQGNKRIYLNKEKNYKIIIDESRCKSCSLCVEICPKDVLALSTDHFSENGYNPSRAIAPEKCIACYKCENTCPDFAIYILRGNKTQEDRKNARR